MLRSLRNILRNEVRGGVRRPARRGRPILLELEGRRLLATTQAAAAAYITGLYQADLLRTPSAAETEYWVGVLDRRGARFVGDAILGSAERQQLVEGLGVDLGGPPASFVGSLYTGLLGRQPDAAGEAFWLRQVRRGETREQIVQSFLSSSESAATGLGSTRPALAATTTTLVASPNPAQSYQAVTIVATVTQGSSGGSPSGSVTFYNGSTYLGFATLVAGSTYRYSTGTLLTGLPVGSNPIKAVYSGSSIYAPSTSSTLTVKVT